MPAVSASFLSILTRADVVLAAPLFLVASAVVVMVAPRLTATVGVIAQRTTFGSSLAGSVLLGASTSLPGIVVTAVAALRGDVALAAANAVGGVVAQTTFLSVADLAQRRDDLFRNAASAKALTQLGLLLALLSVPLFAITGWPDATIGRVHPASLILVAVYIGGVWTARKRPAEEETAAHDEAPSDEPLWRVWSAYALYVVLVGIAGVVIGTTISPIASALGLTSLAAGALITAAATSSPELVTAVTAARRGQLDLAVGDIVGGNTFDVLFLAVADVVVAMSLYRQLGNDAILLIAAAILLNAILLFGAARRNPRSFSPESVLMLLVYLTLAVALVTQPP